MPLSQLHGKTAVVTGAGRGIGRSIAHALADRGVRVVLLSRSRDELDQVEREIRDHDGVAFAVPLDVGDSHAVAATTKRILEEFGDVELLVNNAAVVWPLGPSVSVDVSEWARALAINVVGVVDLTIALLPGMLSQGSGRIVNVSSGIAQRPQSMIGGNAYATSKAALEAHTLNLAAELADTGVTVNAYRPGGVDTEMQAWIRRQSGDEIGTGLHQQFVASFEEGRLITPEASADSLMTHLETDSTGQIWSFAG
jgi:3-oxoacyl-[acyl-carrier protein] reductase